MTEAPGPAVRPPTASRQLGFLLSVWWKHMRRRARRVGDAPKRAGAPTLLLLNLLSTAYMVSFVWRSVTRSVEHEPGFFAWHMLAVLSIALGTGVSKGAGALQLRGMRNDAFLEPLPLAPLARIALQLADSFFVIPFAIAVPIAAGLAQDSLPANLLPAAALGVLAFLAFFWLGQAAVAWARALGPASTPRISGYVGVGLNIGGMVGAFSPLGQIFDHSRGLATQLTRLWLAQPRAQLGLAACSVALVLLAYRALLAAERLGFDRIDAQHRAPKQQKGVRDRVGLEWQMMLRQGGRALLIVFLVFFFVAGVGGVWSFWKLSARSLPPSSLLILAGFAIYLGAVQTIAQAGRAARSDLLARPFLAALPLSPHHVLDGKARALRRLLSPVLVILAMLAGVAVFQGEFSNAYRIVLALCALYVVVDGTISVAFLSNGIGVAGVGGGQPSSGFSTQLLMMPLLATVAAPSDWAATTAFLAVALVTRESRRAAHKSVRWLDDSSDDLERETTVWRALLAATGFFTLQALTYQLLAFDLPPGYKLAVSYGSGALLLALLTWRNGARFERPRFLPNKLVVWPLGAIGGALSGLLALWLAKLFPPPEAADLPSALSTGEVLSLFFTMTLAAPLVEEYFFRGWLQKAIEADLPATKKHWAFALGALAFALAHLGSYGVPQLVLGLLAGALYAFGGGLWPGILAHAIHNGLVLLAGS